VRDVTPGAPGPSDALGRANALWCGWHHV